MHALCMVKKGKGKGPWTDYSALLSNVEQHSVIDLRIDFVFLVYELQLILPYFEIYLIKRSLQKKSVI
jgi:hypothetical protein